MNRNEKIQLLNEAFSQVPISLSETQTDQFLDYYSMLVEWNQKMNLTAITDYSEVVLKHFTDSVSVVKLISPGPGEKLIDVGTGAGFPGIPLKIICPELHITLLDSLRKRVDFLNAVINNLGLDRTGGMIEAFHGRAEEFARDPSYRSCYDYAVSRAVSNLSTISEYCLLFLKLQGIFIAYKSNEIQDEVSQYGKGLEKLGGKLEEINSFSLKNKEITLNRSFAMIRKTDETPEQYPRRAGIPEKRPIK